MKRKKEEKTNKKQTKTLNASGCTHEDHQDRSYQVSKRGNGAMVLEYNGLERLYHVCNPTCALHACMHT